MRYIDSHLESTLQLYIHYKNGHLPYQGGVLNQPNRLMEEIMCVGQVYEICSREELPK